MSDSEQMRAEFEIAAKQYNYLTVRLVEYDYTDSQTRAIWNFYQLGYAAGRKAEREAIASEVQSFAKQNGYPWKVRMAFNVAAARIRNRTKGD